MRASTKGNIQHGGAGFMINEILKSKFPFVSNYFETLIKNNIDRFPQSIVFEGSDIIAQYMFAAELSRILNCTGEIKNPDCTCINCNWIREIKHPSVNIVSPINFKDDSSKTVISIAQAKKVTSSLSETCDYHRVFIFCDAKIKQRSAAENASVLEYKNLGTGFPEENWTPLPLNMKVFKAEASNSLLKSIEEPPERTTFIFLTKSREDLISTIVSRSNVFKLTGGKDSISVPLSDDFKTALRGYPNLTVQEALEAAYDIENILKSTEIDIFDFLNEFQGYILEFLKNNINNNNAAKMFEHHIKLVQTAKKRLGASMSAKVVLESLFLSIAQTTH